MASILRSLSLTIFFVFLLFTNPTSSADSPESSPSPSPQLPPVAISAPPESISPSPVLPLSPPSPSSDLAPNSPSPAPEQYGASSDPQNSPSPAPEPDVVEDVHDDTNDDDLETKQSDGMNRGEKFGIAIGVIGAACVVGLGAVVYKKRQQNIRRAQYSYATTKGGTL